MSLCALSAFQVQASVEARMYSLGTLLCVVSTGATIRLLKRPESGQAWCLLCVVTIASLYTHHLLAVTAAVQAGFLVARCFARSCPKKDRIADVRLRKFCVVTIGCVLIAWIPALILWWKQVSRVSRGFWIVPMDRWSLPRVCLEFVVAPPPSLWWNYRYWGIPLTALFLCILGRVWMRGGVVRRLLVCQAVVPMIVIALVSLKTPLWEGRYFRFAHISLLMCVAIFLSDLRSKRLRVGFGGLIFATFLTGGFVFWSLRDIPERQAVRGAMGWLQEQDVDSQRPLIVTSPMNFVIAKYYAPMFGRSRDKIWLYTGEERNPHAAVHLVRQSDWWPDDELPDDELPDDAWILHKNHEMPSHTIPKSPVFQSDTWIDEWSIRVSLTSSQLSQ